MQVGANGTNQWFCKAVLDPGFSDTNIYWKTNHSQFETEIFNTSNPIDGIVSSEEHSSIGWEVLWVVWNGPRPVQFSDSIVDIWKTTYSDTVWHNSTAYYIKCSGTETLEIHHVMW